MSRSKLTRRDDELDQGLRAILETSRANNRPNSITGVLMVSCGFFCQILEGPRELVEHLFESIELDDRHTDVTVLEYGPIAERFFEQWDMAFINIDRPDKFETSEIKASINDLVLKSNGRSLVNVFAGLVMQREVFES